MSKLIEVVARWLEEAMAREVATLAGSQKELRAVFFGPPEPLLSEVFQAVAPDGRLLTANDATGAPISFPAILQVEELPAGLPEGGPGNSGACLFNRLADLRNEPGCGVFLTLVAPGSQTSDTHASTRKAIGLAPEIAEGTTTISGWWNDAFVQHWVDDALKDIPESGGATRLVREGIYAADAAQEHAQSRLSSWRVLERLWAAKSASLSPDAAVSMAAGFPPAADGSLDADAKVKVLTLLAERLEKLGLGGAIEQFKARSADQIEARLLDEFLEHLRKRCDAVTALRRAMPYFYAPAGCPEGPAWWSALTVERWEFLLGDDNPPPPPGKIQLECMNPLIAGLKGFVPVVKDEIELRATLPEELEGLDLVFTRAVGSSVAGRRSWIVPGSEGKVRDTEDAGFIDHKAPIRVFAEVANPPSKASLRFVSLATWQPGVVVCSRTATKGDLPKASRTGGVDFETELSVSGLGRHYLDLYLRPGVAIVGNVARCSDEHGRIDSNIEIPILGGEEKFGLEVEANGDSFVQFEIHRPESDKPEVVRVNLSAEATAPDQCSSVFEMLLLQNSKDNGKAPRAVQVNDQLRSSQLQAWSIEEGVSQFSFLPLVLAPDYASHWRRPKWDDAEGSIVSAGRYLNDPRPRPEEMQPPTAFLETRAKIAEAIRGDEGGLIEAAPLGEWLAGNEEFAALVDAYVRSYQSWLQSRPDEACWCDMVAVARFEPDGVTLQQVPDALVVSPLHPVRLAWQCLAQLAMFHSRSRRPCPAASILDPDCIPDSLSLPLRDASGNLKRVEFFSVECNSDYWGILWNSERLDLLAKDTVSAPLDREMGLLVGGISRGFSASQVHRAMDEVCEMLVAKPSISVMVSSASGQNTACNEGILSWGRKHFAMTKDGAPPPFGAAEVKIFDERRPETLPDDAEISNIAEDTENAIKWYRGAATQDRPDLAIIAQLETSNAGQIETHLFSPLGFAGLLRTRIREQLGTGQILCESRSSIAASVSGEGLADLLALAISKLENLGDRRQGYQFAPSVHAIASALERAEFAAVSSSSVDPACFLGDWLKGTYLWDYDLPCYSGRAGDSSGYYLLSGIKPLDLETLRSVLSRLPKCKDLSDEVLKSVVKEVARRGIPTVRGLSAGDSGATGDVGLLVATRLLQDCFGSREDEGLLPPWREDEGGSELALVIPVDPFRGYLADVAKAIGKPTLHRPDLLVACIRVTASSVACRLTPVEVKNRGGENAMPPTRRSDGLAQARTMAELLEDLRRIYSDAADMLMWRLAHEHLLVSMLGYGFRVYGQRVAVKGRTAEWAQLHTRVMQAILAQELSLEVDTRGRLIVIDGSKLSGPSDTDADGFRETIQLNQSDASDLVLGNAGEFLGLIRNALSDWDLRPAAASSAVKPVPEQLVPDDAVSSVAQETAFEDLQAQHMLEETVESTVPVGPPPLAQSSHGPVAAVSSNGAEEQTGLEVRVGTQLDGFRKDVRYLNLGDTGLNQLNMGVVGDLGTGKTQLLKSIVFQVAKGAPENRGVRPNVLIFDYKKDYTSDEFVEAVGARVIKPQHLPINLFDLKGASPSLNPWLDRFRFFADALEKIYSGIGPVQRNKLKSAIRDAYSACGDGKYPTIYDVAANYEAGLKAPDSLSSILSDLVDMELFTPNASDIVSPDEFLKGIVVIPLNEIGQDDRTKNMLVAIMLNVFYEHMLRIPKRPFLGANRNIRVVDSMLLVDEADNIMKYEFDVLRKVLLQGREFGVGVILASQYLSHFKQGSTDYREPLLTWFIHKVPNIRAQELSALGLSDPSALVSVAERVKSLGLHECLYKSHDAGGEFISGAPFYQRSNWA